MTSATPSPTDSAPTDIYYVHSGPIPRYLLCSLENTRVFNPDARIFLIGDHTHAQFDRLEVTLVPIKDLPQTELEVFQKSYVHTSGNPEGFERFCFSRWFLLKEAMLAFRIEAQLSKDQVLELYMNQIYLGSRAYGFEAAAQTYFGKTLATLSPAECAMLAGLPQNPRNVNPIRNPERAGFRAFRAARPASAAACAPLGALCVLVIRFPRDDVRRRLLEPLSRALS